MLKDLMRLFKNISGAAIGFAFVCIVLYLTTLTVSASPNISSTYPNYWGWNDVMGWIDFYDTKTINIGSNQTTTGYAGSSAGYISLDCATTYSGNICGTSNYGVYNPGNGNLTGWGWNNTYGWISFDCHNNGGCGSGPSSSTYQVEINPATGDFGGTNTVDFAWNDIVGWISFNCSDYGGCGTSIFKVNTTWQSTSTSGYLDSTTYDTGVAGGAELNSIVWQGPSLPAGTAVRFQIAASSTPNGPWNFIGPDGTGNGYYVGLGAPGSSIQLDYVLHNNQRYFRYRVILVSDQTQKLTPTVNSISVNWSP